MSILQIKSLVQFSRGGSIVWNSLVTPLPNGVVAFAIDDLSFKLGDGITLYSALPTLFTFNDLISAQGGISGLFELPVALDQGEIVSISIGGSGELEYRPSGTTLSSVLTRISDLETSNSNQTAAIAGVLAAALDINVNINTAPDNHIVVINNGLYSDSGLTVADLESQVAAAIDAVPGTHLVDVVFYSDINMTLKADKTNLTTGVSYYVRLSGHSNRANTSITYDLTTTNPELVITKLSDDSFKITTSGVTVVSQDIPIALIASTSNNFGGTASKAISIRISKAGILTSVYGGSDNDYFEAVTTDSNDNIICAGYTFSEGAVSSALVVKFDSNLNILVRKIYGGANEDSFRTVAIDASNNIICAGHTYSEGANRSALVVKFDSDLNILVRKIYSGSSIDIFYAVAIDSSNNIICAGHTASEGAVGSALVVKFDSNLVILARKIYGGANSEEFFGVAIDSNDNIICVGNTYSEGTGSPTYPNALVVKFDSDLNTLARKIYSGSNHDAFMSVAIDSSNNIICVGRTNSEGTGSPTYYNAFVTKLPMNIPSGTFVGTILTGLTLTDSNLTLADSALALSDSNLTLANSTLTLTNSALTLDDSALTQEKEEIPT